MTKELEALDRLYDNLDCNDYFFRDDASEDCNLIETALKALEIVKRTEVNIHYFKSACTTMSYEQYFSMWNDGCFVGIQMTSKTMLTQEEYELLKEVLL